MPTAAVSAAVLGEVPPRPLLLSSADVLAEPPYGVGRRREAPVVPMPSRTGPPVTSPAPDPPRPRPDLGRRPSQDRSAG
jgi:hypothetical protein